MLFNTTVLIGPDGVLSRYRKVNPWIPWEVHASPHDIPDYAEDPFPVVDTELGKLGVAICYDWLFPETIRQIAFNGAEVIIRVSAYMDPWGATAPMDWWTLVNRTRALENTVYVVACNQGASHVTLPAVQLARRQHGGQLRRTDPGPGRPGAGREGGRGADRHQRPARGTEAPPGTRYARPFPQRDSRLRGQNTTFRRGPAEVDQHGLTQAAHPAGERKNCPRQ